MKPSFLITLFYAMALACCWAITTPAFADIAPPPGEPYIRPSQPSESDDEPVAPDKPSEAKPSEAKSTETKPTETQTLKSNARPVRKGCGMFGFAEITVLCFVAAAVIQLRRISKINSPHADTSTDAPTKAGDA